MDYHQKLVDQALLTMDTYLGQFPDIKVRGLFVHCLALVAWNLQKELESGKPVMQDWLRPEVAALWSGICLAWQLVSSVLVSL